MAVNGIIGIKLGMTQIFQTDGTLVGCTVLQAGPCVVVQRRTKENDGYEAAPIITFPRCARQSEIIWSYNARIRPALQEKRCRASPKLRRSGSSCAAKCCQYPMPES